MRWHEEEGGPVLRQRNGMLLARVSFTGLRWRATTWTRKGSSSLVSNNLREAIEWCEEELGFA